MSEDHEKRRREFENAARLANKDPEKLEAIIHDIARLYAQQGYEKDKLYASWESVVDRTPEKRVEILIQTLDKSKAQWTKLEVGDVKIERKLNESSRGAPADEKGLDESR